MIEAIVLAGALSATDLDEICGNFGIAAKQTMIGRQEGVPISTPMGLAGENDLLRAMIRDAYNEPRYSGKNAKLRAIEDFQSDIEAACYSAFENLR